MVFSFFYYATSRADFQACFTTVFRAYLHKNSKYTQLFYTLRRNNRKNLQKPRIYQKKVWKFGKRFAIIECGETAGRDSCVLYHSKYSENSDVNF